MNKNAIQKFAIWARNELIAQVSQRAYQYGIDESGFGDASADTLNGRLLTAEEKSQRQELIKKIKEKGYKQVMEEVAYTWFNRFIALRFMEVNNYLPSHIRVFSDASGAFKPEILNDVLHLDLPGLDSGKVAEYIESNDTEALYRYLLLTQCNALNSALPVMFERMGSYTEMLLPNNILRQDSVLGHMVSDIPEGDWQDAVQIIGWLYQYYNTELKDDTFAQLKKNVKITKERIPAATQLFTPDWIVRYMVENSLGRIYIDKRKNEGAFADGRGLDEMTWHEVELKRIANEKYIADQMGWKYYITEAEQTPEVRRQIDEIEKEHGQLKLEEIKVIDPCMGSGHILVYAFDVLMQIYTSAGWDQREAAQSILKNNLFGLDIDDRAAQLAYFAVMMKARQYDRRLFTRGIQPNIFSIRESNGIQAMTIEYFHNNNPKLRTDIESIITEMRDAKEYGSILNITPVDFTGLYARFDEIRNDINMMQMSALDELLPLVKGAELLAQKYDVVVTNPPYMAVSNAGAKVNDYVKKNFPDSKADMFAVFIERCGQMAKKNGYQAMITQHSWMFLSKLSKLREKIQQKTIINLVHLGARAFEDIAGEVVQTASFVISNTKFSNYRGKYCRLVSEMTQQEKERSFLSHKKEYIAQQENYKKIPDMPISYQLSSSIYSIFEKQQYIGDVASAKQGLGTSDNNSFLRFWTEVNFHNIGFGLSNCEETLDRPEKWFPYIKGGSFRRWYPSKEYVVNYQNNGMAIKSAVLKKYPYLKTPDFVVKNTSSYFGEGITWSDVATGKFSARWVEKGYIFADAGPMLFVPHDPFLKMGYMNTPVFQTFCDLICQGLHYSTGQIPQIPYLRVDADVDYIDQSVNECVTESKKDWDAYETSWDFKRNPLV